MSINTTKQDEKLTSVKKRVTLLRLFRYMLDYRSHILLVIVIMLITVAITTINPLIIQSAIDNNVANKDFDGLLKLGLFAFIINSIFVAFVKLRMYIMAKISNKILLTIRQELYTHIQKLGFHFFDSRPTGKILARIVGDVNSLKDILSNSVTTLIPDFITICSVVVIMLVINWKLALASLIAVPLMMSALWFIQTRAHLYWQLWRKKGSNLTAMIHEDLSGVRIIQSFTAEEETQDSFEELLTDHRNAFVKAVRLNDAFFPSVDISWSLGSVTMYFVAVKILKIDAGSVGTLMAFAMYITMFWQPIMNLSNFYNSLITNMTGAERIFEILDTTPELTDYDSVTELPAIDGKVQFDHVSFSYDEDSKVLNDVSFTVNAGETIALVGPTGAGKSTIVNLISRFYDINHGNIYIDGYNVKDVTIESLRKQMGIMTQENFLFSGTIADNIRYGKLDATQDEIIAASKAVNAHDFIMKLENGYETELKERGSGLSIGQRQLLAFARTMISMPKILILDEATSSIDTHTELLVQEGIQALLKGRTSFVIAHRLSTISKADRIFVVDEGKILEEGSSDELLAKKGLYYELYMAQFKNL